MRYIQKYLAFTAVWCVCFTFACYTSYSKDSCNELNPFQNPEAAECLEPVAVKLSNLNMRLYNRDIEYPIVINFNRLYNISDINKKSTTKIIIPGWAEGYDEAWVMEMKNEYLHNGIFNIMIFDWTKYAYYPYTTIPSIAKACGEYLGNLLVELHRKGVLQLQKVHIIGHSIGVHIAGFAGKETQKKSAKLIARITGLNAAGVNYEYALPGDRIYRNDASFVDGIHAHDKIFEMQRAYGKVDFYVGSSVSDAKLRCIQPTNFPCYGMHRWMECKHRETFKIWTSSIRMANQAATGVIKADTAIIGEHCPLDIWGIYNLVSKPGASFRQSSESIVAEALHPINYEVWAYP